MIKIISLAAVIICGGILGAHIGFVWQYILLMVLCLFAGIGAARVDDY